jgi:hypothetical protein
VYFERDGSFSDRFRKADNLLHRFALHMQRHQERCDLRIRALAGEHLGHNFAGFITREGLTMSGDAMERVEDHTSKL